MKVAFVKVLEVSGLPVRKPDTHQILVKLSPANQGSYGALFGTKPLTCDAIWSFVYEDPSSSALVFTIFSYDPAKAEVARVTLPLSWFPRNAVVTYDYPCRLVGRGAGDSLWAKVQVHLSEAGQPGFEGPPGALLVKPAWTAPQATASRQSFFGQAPLQQTPQFPPPPQFPAPRQQSIQSTFPRPYFPPQPGQLAASLQQPPPAPVQQQQPPQSPAQPQPSASAQQQPAQPSPLRQSQAAPLDQQPSPLQQTHLTPQHPPVVAPIQQQPVVLPMQQSPVVSPVQQQTVLATMQQQPVFAPVQQPPVVSPLQQTQYPPFMASPHVPFAVPVQQTRQVPTYGLPMQYGAPMTPQMQYGTVPQFAYGIGGQDPRQTEFAQYPMPVIGGGYPAQYIYPYAPTYVAQYPVAAQARATAPAPEPEPEPAPAKQPEAPPKPAQPTPPAGKPKKKTKKPKGSSTEYFEIAEDDGETPSFQDPQDPSRFTAVSGADAQVQGADLKPLAVPSTHPTARPIDPSMQGSLVEDQLADSFLPQYPTI
jgi:hypothetical protein